MNKASPLSAGLFLVRLAISRIGASIAAMINPLEDYDKIYHLMAELERADMAGDEGFELTMENERLLDRLWVETANRNRPKPVSATMSDSDTLDFFGLSH